MKNIISLDEIVDYNDNGEPIYLKDTIEDPRDWTQEINDNYDFELSLKNLKTPLKKTAEILKTGWKPKKLSRYTHYDRVKRLEKIFEPIFRERRLIK